MSRILILQVSSLLWGKYLILEDPFKDSFLPTPWGESRPYIPNVWMKNVNFILSKLHPKAPPTTPTKVSTSLLPGASLKFYTFLHQGFLNMLTNLPRYGQSDDNGEIGGRYSETLWPGENMSAYLFTWNVFWCTYRHHTHNHTHKYHKYINNTSVWTCVYIYLQIDIYHIYLHKFHTSFIYAWRYIQTYCRLNTSNSCLCILHIDMFKFVWALIHIQAITRVRSHPPNVKILLRAYQPLVSLNKALLNPYFIGWEPSGGWVDQP